MKAELTSSQIDELNAFVEKKGVKPLDVRIELVDHLASDIEHHLSSAAGMTFEEALEKVYVKFERWGFDDLVQQAENNVRQRHAKLIWKLFIDFFKWPKAVITITIAVVIWKGFMTGFFSKYSGAILIPILFILCGYAIFAIVRHQRMKKPITTAMPPAWLSSCAQIPTFLNIFLGSFFQEVFMLDVFSVWATMIITLSIIFTWASIEVYEQMLVESRRLYPQAFA